MGPPSTSGLPDWHFPPIFYLAAAQPRAPPDGLCLQARPQASAPNKGPCCGTVLHHSTPLPPPPHSHSHRHAAHTEQMEHRRGWLFVQGHSGNGVFAFIYTTHDSFIADLSYVRPSERRERLFQYTIYCDRHMGSWHSNQAPTVLRMYKVIIRKKSYFYKSILLCCFRGRKVAQMRILEQVVHHSP